MVKKTRKMKTGDLGGFTIIEVILVLAIAGLIFLMVFIALPVLRRSQRDSQRRQDMVVVENAMTNYQQNNNGKLPTTPSSIDPTDGDATLPECSHSSSSTNMVAACFLRNYINSTNATENAFVDPDGWYYGLKFQTLTNGETDVYVDELDYTVYIYEHAKCNDETAEYSANSRDYAIMYKLEGSGTYCKSNS